MREIKFRTWDTERKRMIYESYPSGIYPGDGMITPMLYFDGRVALMSDEDGGKSGLWEHDLATEGRLIPLEDTGLKDKNGQEIYEGDIMRAANHCPGCSQPYLAICEYKGSGFWARDAKGYLLFSLSHYEVIGNVYENPELLEVSNV